MLRLVRRPFSLGEFHHMVVTAATRFAEARRGSAHHRINVSFNPAAQGWRPCSRGCGGPSIR